MFSIVHLGVSRIPSKIRGSREKDDFLVDLRIPYFQTQFCFPWPYGTSSCPPLMWICCWSWISTVHQSVMFFMYMQRSTDLEAYISSCKFWSCLFTFCNANTFFFFFLSVSAQTPPKTSQTFSYPILVMWQIQIVNASQLGDVIFFPPISGEDFPKEWLGTLPARPGGLGRVCQLWGTPCCGRGGPCLAEVSPLLQAVDMARKL